MRAFPVRSAAALAIPLLLLAGACGSGDPGTITIVAHDSFTPSEGIFDAFTDRTGLRVEVVRAGDAGQVVTAAGLTPGNPVGDVLWGVDTTLLSRAIDDGIFEPYESPNLAAMSPDVVATVPGREATPVDTGEVCINYDIGWFASRGTEPCVWTMRTSTAGAWASRASSCAGKFQDSIMVMSGQMAGQGVQWGLFVFFEVTKHRQSQRKDELAVTG